jgi:methyl-accepting chemotaxis protein
MARLSYFGYPTALGLAGATALVFIAGLTIASGTSAALLVALAIGAGIRLHLLGEKDRRRASAANTKIVAAQPEALSLRELCLRAMPVWAKQLETSRRAGDEAVDALSRHFGGTVRRITKAVAASRSAVSELSGEGGGMLAAIDRSDADLRGVAGTLENLQATKDAVLDEVKRYAKDLKEMSQTVQHIAMQVRLLSFNAAVEAARAGEAGQSFGVVAAEMRQLAGLSAEAGATMTRKVEMIERIDHTLADMFRSSNGANESGAGAIARADTAIRDVMERFKRLTKVLSNAVEIMESESESVGQEISDALVQLQFQDRVSQIVAHVATNCTSLTDSLKRANGAAIDADQWMNEMALQFSTHEEFDNLDGKAGRARKTDTLTFF